MIAKLRAFMLSSEPILSLTDDSGQSMTYDRKGAWEMLQQLDLEEERLVRPRRFMKHVDLGNAFE